MNEQEILFVVEDKSLFSNSKFWQQLRLCIYDLRENAFKKNASIKLSFCQIQDSENQNEINFSDLNTFSLKQDFHKALNKISLETLKHYLKTYEDTTPVPATGPKIIYFQKNSNDVPVTKSQILVVKNNEVSGFSEKVRGFLRKNGKSLKSVITPKVMVILLCSILGIAVISSLPFIISKIKTPKYIYKTVFTGDGDRLIMRQEPSKEADEIIRLIEGETVILLEEGEEWDKVNYHGLAGYCHNEYLIPAEENDYVIFDSEAKYYYGKACCRFLEPEMVNGYDWIIQAAEEGLLRAQWVLVGFYDKGSTNLAANINSAIKWCSAAYENEKCLEENQLEDWRKLAQMYENKGDTELTKKYKDKIKERERDIKIIRQQSAKYLCEVNLENNIQEAAAYYKKALELGIKGDGDLMYELGTNQELSEKDRFFWLEKAASVKNVSACYYLADYYETQGSYSKAITYYKKMYEADYEPAKVTYKIALIYWNDLSDYVSSFPWFVKARSYYQYDFEYYDSCWAIGNCYENGYGCYKSISSAMQYYGEAYYQTSKARNSYDKLYRKYGDNYSWY